MDANAEIAWRLFAALQAGDHDAVRELCADEFAGNQNGGPASNLETMLRFSRAVKRVAPDFRYENAVRSGTQDGFVEEHDACGALADGTGFRLAVCVVGTVAAGRVTSLREYLDTAQAAPLLKALRTR